MKPILVNPAIALAPSQCQNARQAHRGRGRTNAHAVRHELTIAVGVNRLILEDAIDVDGNRVTLWIGHPKHIDRHELWFTGQIVGVLGVAMVQTGGLFSTSIVTVSSS